MNEQELLKRFPNASKSTIARNTKTIAVASLPQPEPPMTIAPTTDYTKLNKTEQAYYDALKTNEYYKWVGPPQCLTLKLGDDCRYTPDFICINFGGDLIAKEVKGFWRDDAKVKIKVAARLFPFIRFHVVQKVKGDWITTLVKP